MPHAVTTPSEPLSTAGGRLSVHLVPAWKDNLIWVITASDSDQAWAVDGPEAQGVLDWCEAHGKHLAGILNTHTHPDHIGINRELAERGALDGLRVIGSADPKEPIPGQTEQVSDGDTVQILGETVRVLRTDGHQDGHVSYVLDDVLFCGDTLFAGGCGYLFDGPPAAMLDSLLRLAALPPSTRVCCAHEYTQDNLRFAWMVEPDNAALAERIRQDWATRAQGRCTVPSTIALERATNPFLRPGSPTLRARVAEHLPQADVSTDLGAFTATRTLKNQGVHKPLGDQPLPLEAAGTRADGPSR